MLKPGFYRSLSGKRAACIFLALRDADERMGTHRAARFAMRFEGHGNATSVECFIAALEGQGFAGDARGHERVIQDNAYVVLRYSVTAGPVSHVHARPLAPATSRRVIGLARRVLAMVNGGRLTPSLGAPAR